MKTLFTEPFFIPRAHPAGITALPSLPGRSAVSSSGGGWLIWAKHWRIRPDGRGARICSSALHNAWRRCRRDCAALPLSRSAASALATDTLLGILSQTALALGLIVAGLMTCVSSISWYSLGDVLTVSTRDVILVWAGGAAVLAVLAWLWRDLLASHGS